MPSFQRRLPVGADWAAEVGTDFRLWAPRAQRVDLVLESLGVRKPVAELPMAAEPGGYFHARTAMAGPGTHYRFRLDGLSALYPDLASRCQPEGPLGPSMVVDPSRYRWTDQRWPGVKRHAQVVYEMHIGTFTEEGTWSAAREQLAALAATGITLLEVMPVGDFAGEFGWGYDGVNLFAPYHRYGTPDEMRAFVDRAHEVGLGVILDVVYHRCGIVGNCWSCFADDYFTDRYHNEWGNAVNFDGPNSAPVRELICANARYWIEEYHLDGYRIDATQAFFDTSRPHILEEVTAAARAAAGSRPILVVAESEPQESRLIRPVAEGGFGMDAAWNDDFHHSAVVRLTGRREAYYTDHAGSSEEFVAAARWGYLFQGQWYRWQGKPRGKPALDIPLAALVNYLQNHDQLANTGFGTRLHHLASPGQYRAMTALWLLMPTTPLFFQGQEFGADSPFLYFADHEGELRRQVDEGRKKFLAQFPSLGAPDTQAVLPDPADPETFRRCKLDHAQRSAHRGMQALHVDLLRLRREDPAISSQDRGQIEGATLGEDALLLRYFSAEHGDRLLLVNFGPDLPLVPRPQPLLAPPLEQRWESLWSSEDLRYGGRGIRPVDAHLRGEITGECAVLLVARKER